MVGSVKVGVVEVYEGLRLFVTQDRLNSKVATGRGARSAEQAMDNETGVTAFSDVGQMRLRD